MKKFKIGDVVIGKFVDVEIKVLDVGDMIFKGEVLKVKFKEMSSYKEGEIIEGLLMEYFRIIKEDKMENRIVRKLEDLDGLENGMGAIAVYDEINNRIRAKEERLGIGIAHSDEYSDLDGFLTAMKAMGFKFEYKPLRTVHEVIQEIKSLKSLTFKQGELNYFVSCCEDKYRVEAMRETFIIGVNYMTIEQAQKYADELNEIIGVGK